MSTASTNKHDRSARRPPRRRRYFWNAGAVGVLVVAAVFWAWPILDSNRRQDQCSFGTATNDHYRQFLAAASFLAQLDRAAWEDLVRARDRERGSEHLQHHFDILSAGMTSVADRVAVMHAVARAHGAEFRHTEPDAADPWSMASEQIGNAVLFVYRFNVNRAKDWRFLQPWIRIRGKFAIEHIDPNFEYTRAFERNTMSMLLSTRGAASRLGSPRRSRIHDCPPVPELAWELSYLGGQIGNLASAGTLDDTGRAIFALVRMGDNFMARDRPRLALRYLERAAALQLDHMGENHIERAAVLDKLAAAYASSGQPLKAADYSGQAMDIRIKVGTAAEATSPR